MKKYEAMLLARPNLVDADVKKIADRYKKLIEDRGGKVQSAGKWDKRKLAYPIDDMKEANFILLNFEADTTVPQELGRQMRIHDEVVRYRIFTQE